jgi:hypothetical protein
VLAEVGKGPPQPRRDRDGASSKEIKMQDVKFVIEEKYPTGKSFKEPEIPLKKKIEALARLRHGEFGPVPILAGLWFQHCREAPEYCARMLSKWASMILWEYIDGNAEVIKLCHETGFIKKPEHNPDGVDVAKV